MSSYADPGLVVISFVEPCFQLCECPETLSARSFNNSVRVSDLELTILPILKMPDTWSAVNGEVDDACIDHLHQFFGTPRGEEILDTWILDTFDDSLCHITVLPDAVIAVVATMHVVYVIIHKLLGRLDSNQEHFD